MELMLDVPFQNERTAEIAWNSLRVDTGPKRSGLTQQMSVHGTHLHVQFKCVEARTLRVGVNSFFDLLNLVVETIEQFDN